MANFIAFNGPMPTTAAQQKVTTGTAIKTLMQLATPATRAARIVEWGISFDGSAAGTPITCELLETGAIAATVTAYVASGMPMFDANDGFVSQMTLGTTASGYTATAEGTITTVRMFDAQLVAPTGGYVKQFPLGERPRLGASRFTRIRVTAAVAVNAQCYIVWDEE